jgi:hypothetical protein
MPLLINWTLLQATRPATARPPITVEVTAGGGGVALDLVVERDGDLCGDERMHLYAPPGCNTFKVPLPVF